MLGVLDSGSSLSKTRYSHSKKWIQMANGYQQNVMLGVALQWTTVACLLNSCSFLNIWNAHIFCSQKIETSIRTLFYNITVTLEG